MNDLERVQPLQRPLPRYRLLDAGSGNGLGLFAASAGDWKVGDRFFYRGNKLVVVRLIEVEPDDDAFEGYLVVEWAQNRSDSLAGR